jgi:glycosyltransferase involved in cell wall biosynthesis
MQKFLVDEKWEWCRKDHIRLDYSEKISEVGHFQFSKLIKLFKVLYRIWRSRRAGKIDVLYYPPAGPSRVPLYRDIITLLFAKLLTRKIILHFHAGGLSELIEKLNPIERFFVKHAFKNIDHAIILLPWLKKETEWFFPKKIHIIPNGIKDVAHKYVHASPLKKSNISNILFVGNLKEEKGIFVLLSAVDKLKKLSNNFKVSIMGEAHSPEVQKDILNFIEVHSMRDNVVLLGSLSGDDKWKEFSRAHIFCLPTFATEAMPVSILEAMMFSLPVVTTDWRGIPDIITHGEDGFLVPIKNDEALAEKLFVLIQNPVMCTH